MNQKAIVARHPAIFGKPLPNKYGLCPTCNTPLIREYSGGYDDYFICCPESHYNPGHTCYLEGDRE